jgi:hypothetical protein
MGLFHVVFGCSTALVAQVMVNNMQKLPLYAKPWRYVGSAIFGSVGGMHVAQSTTI